MCLYFKFHNYKFYFPAIPNQTKRPLIKTVAKFSDVIFPQMRASNVNVM